MSGDGMLEEIRTLLESDREISDRAAMRLMLKSQIKLLETLEMVQQVLGVVKEEQSVSRMARENMRADRDYIKGELEKLKNNLAVRVGFFITGNRVLASFLGVVILLLMNLWFISGFRRAVLLMFQVPGEIIDFLAPIS